MKYVIPALIALSLSACANKLAVPEAQIATCDTVNGALMSIGKLDDNGMLTNPQKKIVIDVVSQTTPICGSGAKLAADPGSDAQVLTGAIVALQGILADDGAK